ncbi:MAG: ribosomal protein S18-alanine N-acetyltransferase [Selenomonadaceae bacterium]|nr:ribosomal protein S18-alanine N-acetyltransferase [Selenomonadaceae bacterium]
MGTAAEIIFRPMQISDVEAVAEMDEICFEEDGWDEDFFLEELRDEHSDYIVGEIEGKIIACAGIKIYLDEAEGMTIAVLPEFQGRGVGKKILTEIIKIAKMRGAKSMIFEVRVSNVPALHIYQKFGFKIVGRIKRYYVTGEDALTMCAKLEDLKCKLPSEK